jgi:type I restriction enzyme S subunit
MKWDDIQLGEVMDVKHGFAFKGEFFVNSGEYVLLTPGNCYESGGLKLKGDKEKFYAGDFPEEYLLNEGDMLVVMTDLMNTAPILGGSFFIPESNRFLHNQRLGLVQIKDENRINKGFLYYLLNTHNYRGQIKGSASGATVRHTSPGRIKQCKVRVPYDVAYQRTVGETLFAYDNLIENNYRRMVLLEDAARLLYKEWFVDLRFPGHEHIRVVKGVPEGWERKSLSELADVVMGQSPESKFYNADGEGLPFHQGVTDFGNRFITHRTYCTSLNRIAQVGDILCSVRAPVGRLNITMDKIVIGRGLAALRSKMDSQSFLFYQLRTHFFKEDLIGSGVIYASVTKKEFESQLMLTPTKKLIYSFEEVSFPIDEQIRVLFLQNQKLQAARDILLPRLMNGEIQV